MTGTCLLSIRARPCNDRPVADEWFRSPAWGPEDREEFERRLRRARSDGRGQYMRIKGLALRDAGEFDGARDLWERVLEDPGFQMERWSSLEHLADLFFASDPARAEALYRQLLAENPTLNGTTEMAEVRLAELLTRKDSPEGLREAGELLKSWANDRQSPFPANHFRWEVALARWGAAVGDEAVTVDAARRALAHVEAGSPFPRHPGVGLVQADTELLNWLRELAAGSSPHSD